MLADETFRRELEAFVATAASTPGGSSSLAQVLLKLTCPGVPDIYQGTELWDLSLVDPDNRRPVDFARRHRLLGELEGIPVAAVMERADEGLPEALGHHARPRLEAPAARAVRAGMAPTRPWPWKARPPPTSSRSAAATRS